MFGDEGYTTLFRLRGFPVRMHWSFILIAVFITGFRFAPGVWVGYFVLILLHELGHGMLARRYGCHVIALDIHGLGGLCSYVGETSLVQRSIIAWGGVLAQGVLALLAFAFFSFVRTPATAFELDLTHVFYRINLFIALLNLIPMRGFDGYEAWRLFGRLRARSGARSRKDAAPGSYAEGLAQRLAELRGQGQYSGDASGKKGSEGSSPVTRIERGPDGQVRIVVEDSEDSDRLLN